MIKSHHSSQNDHGRLGLTKPPKTTLRDVPFPSRLRIPDVRIVSLVAGGMFVLFSRVLCALAHMLFRIKVIPCPGFRWFCICLG